MSPIRFLILSDTHDTAFPSLPLSAGPETTDNAPPIDVVLHCGDLTMIGGLSNYRRAISNILSIPAQLYLVIPGNHDVSLDPEWWAANLIEDEDNLEESARALTLFEDAKRTSNGRFVLLSEGLHRFELDGGRSFTIYASPYSPEFGGYAFSYPPEEDRFRGKIPDGHCGCENLAKAVEKTKPLIHCIGHIHEGYGGQRVKWERKEIEDVKEERKSGVIALQVAGGDNRGKSTLLVNAAIMRHGEEEGNKPWIVDLHF
ncbi:Metallo-dependent phosphatase-like protein [Rhypophila decipiens]